MFPACISQIQTQAHREQRAEMLDYAIEHGHGVEVADFYWFDALDDEARSRELVDWYKARLPEVAGIISFHGAFHELNPSAQDNAVRRAALERINNCLDIAEELGASRMVSHSDFNPMRVAPNYLESWAKRLAEFWRTALAGRSIELYIENIWDPNPTSIARVVDEIGLASVGVCFDIGHANLWGKAPLAEWVTGLGSRIKYLHLHDNDRTWDKHLSAGRGTVDWAAVFAALGQQGVSVPATLEMRNIADVRTTLDYFSSITGDDDVGCAD